MAISNSSTPWREHYVHPCAWDQQFAPLSLPSFFAESVAAHGIRPLVDFMGKVRSYAGMHAEAVCFAAWLQQLGIRKGDRVGLYLPNVPAYISAYYGTMIAGAVVVNFSPLYTAQELTAQVADSGCVLGRTASN